MCTFSNIGQMLDTPSNDETMTIENFSHKTAVFQVNIKETWRLLVEKNDQANLVYLKMNLKLTERPFFYRLCHVREKKIVTLIIQGGKLANLGLSDNWTVCNSAL